MCNFVHGPSIAKNRNLLIEAAFRNNCTHIFFIDDDVTCNPDIVFQLLKHDKDVVTGVLLGKSFPHRPYLFDTITEDHMFQYYKQNDQDKGLIPMKGAGFGVLLIKTEVFHKLEEPWIRYNPYLPDELGEDLYFFDRLNQLGVKVYCDLDCLAAHFAHVTVRPTKTVNGWLVTYDTSGSGHVSFLHTEQTKGHLVGVEEER